MNKEPTPPNQTTTFTIPADKIKITGAHVNFSLYANGAKTGDLCMTQAEFRQFEAVVLDPRIYSNQFDLGMMISKHHNMMARGWKMLSVERMKFWQQDRHGYQQNINDAGDFPFAVAKKQVDESNIAHHSEESKLVGAEELLIYHPTPD